MNEWIQLGPQDGEGCTAEMKVARRHVGIRVVCKRYGYGESENGGFVTLTREEALNFSCLLPEVQALIKWALNVRETMSGADLFVHGERELKPFEKEEKNAGPINTRR